MSAQELSEAIAAASLDLVGVPFRLHGRDPRFGLDCVGLVECALRRAGMRYVRAPLGYALRNARIEPLLACAKQNALERASGPIAQGDIILVCPGPAQQHLLVAALPDQFVHAHAGLRKVVRMAAPLPWPIAAKWRASRLS